MKQFFLISGLLISITAWSCNNLDKPVAGDPANINYPKSFSAISANDNLGCLKVPGKDIFCVFDSKERKVLGIYSFENYCRFAYAALINNDVYLPAYSSVGGSSERAILRVSLPTGVVTMLPFYSKYASRFALIDDKVWIDTAEVVSDDKHQIAVYDPKTGESTVTKVPWIFVDRGVMIDNAHYLTVLCNGSIEILNRKNEKFKKINDMFDVVFDEKTVSGHFMPMCTKTICYTIRGNVKGAASSQSILYRIKSLDPLTYTKIITLSGSEEIGPVVEMNGSIYLVTRLKNVSGIKMRKYNSSNLSMTAQTVIPNAYPAVAKGYDAIWCMSIAKDNKSSLLRIDPDKLTVLAHPLQ